VIQKLFKNEDSTTVKNSQKSYYVMHDQMSLMVRRRATKSRTSLHQASVSERGKVRCGVLSRTFP